MLNNGQLLDVLTREGVLIAVTVRYWRATKKLNPEDVGLDPNRVTERLISLGHKKLLPRERLQSFALIESRAHSLVEASSFPFLNGLGHFLPNAKLEEVTAKFRELEREFLAAKADFLRRYADVRSQAVAEWQVAASQLVKEPDRLVAAIGAAFPRLDEMERYFGFAIQLFQIRAPEKLELQAVSEGEQLEIIRAREKAAQDAAAQIHQSTESFVTDCVATMRQQTVQLCEEMLESMRSGKTGVHQRTLNRLIRFIDEFKKLNFVGDRELEEQLERVRQEFLGRTAEEYRDAYHYKVQLEEGLKDLANGARELLTQDSREIVERFGQMGQRKFHLAA